MEEFLANARLAHLIDNNMSAKGVTLQELLEASDEKLALLTPKIGDRIRLRSAVSKIRNDNLTTDFEVVYPKANHEFEEKFPVIKQKLLKLLAERAESNKAEQTTLDLLELAAVGEEQANVAALLGIVALLRQMRIIAVPKKKVWRLSKDETRNGFLPRVSTAAEIGTYCFQRETYSRLVKVFLRCSRTVIHVTNS